MKLLLCLSCQHVFKLHAEPRTCRCGKVGGRYLDDLNAEYWGKEAVPIGFQNSSLAEAVRNRPKDGWGKRFEAFVIPKECDSFRKVKRPRMRP